MQEPTVGTRVHYVHPNGTHSDAEITHVWDRHVGVVNLSIHRRDGIQEDYQAPTVVYSEEPKPYTWHYVEDDPEKES